jgi:hypothetical protein
MRNARKRNVRPDLCTTTQEHENPVRPTTLTDVNHEAEIQRLAKALSGVKRRIHHPKLPNDACYAGVAYRLPKSPKAAAELLFKTLGRLPPGMSLDRIDPGGHYALGNLRYATPKQQTENRRPVRSRSNQEFGDE